jgi:hypothetical protein
LTSKFSLLRKTSFCSSKSDTSSKKFIDLSLHSLFHNFHWRNKIKLRNYSWKGASFKHNSLNNFLQNGKSLNGILHEQINTFLMNFQIITRNRWGRFSTLLRCKCWWWWTKKVEWTFVVLTHWLPEYFRSWLWEPFICTSMWAHKRGRTTNYRRWNGIQQHLLMNSSLKIYSLSLLS